MSPLPLVLLDGPTGTLLERAGRELPAPLWATGAVDRWPDEVSALHRAYAEAGATVHTALTFRASPTAAGDDARRLARLAVAIARAAVPAPHRIAASLAPAFDCWRPDLSPTDALARHTQTAALLAEAGADLILAETHTHPEEALAATRAAVRTGLPVWTALSPGYDGSLLTPAALAEAAARCVDAGAAVVLLNCVAARHAHRWVEGLASLGAPFGVYANAGPCADGLQHPDPLAAVRYAMIAETWRWMGATVLGACCGCGPAHIADLADLSQHR